MEQRLSECVVSKSQLCLPQQVHILEVSFVSYRYSRLSLYEKHLLFRAHRWYKAGLKEMPETVTN